MKRESGVLLNVSSLPGAYGIGCFSADAMNFIEHIASAGFHWWQILPLTVIGEGNSPYSGSSAFGGNYLYLSAGQFEEGLLTDEEKNAAKYNGDIYLTDYEHARWAKKYLLERAFTRITDEIRNKIEIFKKEHAYWLEDYCLFMTLKEMHGQAPWSEWEDCYRYREEKAIAELKITQREKIDFYVYEQYEFFRQWQIIKDFAGGYGVKIFGDMPIYVCYDSADVWANPRLFQLDDEYKMTMVAGVPPDYFAVDGQLWGNPLYDYEYMERDNFEWFIRRIKHNLGLYDMLRIDHFRGFYKYWAVPAGATTAKEGKWIDGVKMKLWNELKKTLPEPNIVAEDLGIIDDEVREYLENTGFSGMRVLQFGFDGKSDNPHLPYNYPKNSVAYTATHDNDTTLGWLLSLDEGTRRQVMEYINCDGSFGWASGGGRCRATQAAIRTILASTSDLAIIALQDLCGYGSDTRMNVPGVAKGNWRYRTNFNALESIDDEFVRRMNTIYGRR